MYNNNNNRRKIDVLKKKHVKNDLNCLFINNNKKNETIQKISVQILAIFIII